MLAVDVTPVGFLDRIPFAPGPLVFVVVVAGWYVRSVRRVNRSVASGGDGNGLAGRGADGNGLAGRGRDGHGTGADGLGGDGHGAGGLRQRGEDVRWPAGRSAAFGFGMAIIAVATLSGLASWEQTSFTVHAVIDMVSAMVAPIFLALGSPLGLARRAAGPAGRDRLGRLVQNRAVRTVSHPASAWVIFGVSLFALYFSGFFAAARAHEAYLQLGHLELLLSGCLLIWPAVGADPIAKRMPPGRRAVDVLFMLPFFTIFGMAMDSYTHTVATGITITDVHAAGDVIWSAGVVIGLAVSAGILYQWLFVDLGRARREEAVDEDTLAMQAALWRVSRLLAKPEAVRAAERAKAIAAETITAQSIPAETISASAHADQPPQ